jgi:hypothetical protein
MTAGIMRVLSHASILADLWQQGGGWCSLPELTSLERES